MGCFAKGCLITLAVTVITFGLLGFGAYTFYTSLVRSLTTDKPVALQVESVSDAAWRATSEKMSGLMQAINAGTERTVEFTAADLNALIARDPTFSGARGKARAELADSLLTLEVVAACDEWADAVKIFTRLRGRYLHARMRLGLEYAHGEFDFDPRSLEAGEGAGGGKESSKFTQGFLQGFRKGFNQSFNREIEKEKAQNADARKRYDGIRTIRLVGDKLVVVTKGGATAK